MDLIPIFYAVSEDAIDPKQASEESGFFSDDEYEEHSKQLVDALSE